MQKVLVAVEVLTVMLIVWALVDALRSQAWRWVATIVVLPGLGAIAWFVAGRPQYHVDATRPSTDA